MSLITESRMNTIVACIIAVKIVFALTMVLLTLMKRFNGRLAALWKPTISYWHDLSELFFRGSVSGLLIYHFWGYTSSGAASGRISISKETGFLFAVFGILTILDTSWSLVRI